MNLTFSFRLVFARVFALWLLFTGFGQQALADGRVVDTAAAKLFTMHS